MKFKKRLIGAGLTLAAAILLTACGKSATDAKTYSSTFGADPTTFNYLLDYAGDNTAIVTIYQVGYNSGIITRVIQQVVEGCRVGTKC